MQEYILLLLASLFQSHHTVDTEEVVADGPPVELKVIGVGGFTAVDSET